MTFRKILVPLAGIDEDSAAFDAAFLLGRKSEAYIEALLAIRMAAADASTSSVKHARESSVTKLMARVRALYRNRCSTFDVSGCSAFDVSGSGVSPKSGLSARLVEAFGSEAELIACHGRMADLIILASTPFSSSARVAQSLAWDRGARDRPTCASRSKACR